MIKPTLTVCKVSVQIYRHSVEEDLRTTVHSRKVVDYLFDTAMRGRGNEILLESS